MGYSDSTATAFEWCTGVILLVLGGNIECPYLEGVTNGWLSQEASCRQSRVEALEAYHGGRIRVLVGILLKKRLNTKHQNLPMLPRSPFLNEEMPMDTSLREMNKPIAHYEKKFFSKSRFTTDQD